MIKQLETVNTSTNLKDAKVPIKSCLKDTECDSNCCFTSVCQTNKDRCAERMR